MVIRMQPAHDEESANGTTQAKAWERYTNDSARMRYTNHHISAWMRYTNAPRECHNKIK